MIDFLFEHIHGTLYEDEIPQQTVALNITLSVNNSLEKCGELPANGAGRT